MKWKFYKKSFFSLCLLAVFYLAYITIYPNDFFLSTKTFKHNNQYIYKKTPLKLSIYKKDIDPLFIEDFISNADCYYEDKNSWLKNNVKRTNCIIYANKKRYFIKRYNDKNLFDWFCKCPFRSSKAMRSFYYALKFDENGIETPKPLALVEERFFFLWTQTYLIFEYINAETLETYFQSQDINRIDFSEEIELILEKLYTNNLVHRDFNTRNLLVNNKKLYVIDLDDVHTYKFKNIFFKKKFLKKHSKALF